MSPLALVVDAPSPRRERLGAALATAGCDLSYATVDSARTRIADRPPDIVVIAAGDPAAVREIECLRQLRAVSSRPQCIFLASVSSEDLAIAALHAGAQRYLREPWTPAMLEAAVAALLPPEPASAEGERLTGGDRLVGRSDAIVRLRAQLARIAPAASNVLILGETGTGKELVAELIHLNGTRAARPFVCINTAAIPDSLLENELFGHERGAFTGASSSEAGKLAAGDGGTIFLDEIGDVGLPIQAKLLRAIESRSINRLGSSRTVQLDARFVAATNGDLETAMAEGRFRKDLYYRLNVVRIELAPLRERAEDIPMLVGHYLLRFNRELGRSVRGLSDRAMEALRAYPWPGNVRELRNVIEALLVGLAPETTGTVDVPPEVMRRLAVAVGAPELERARLLDALLATNWNKSRAAERLAWSRMTLYRKLAKYHLARDVESS